MACENQPTLQTFYVDNEEKQGFVSLDVPISFLDIKDKLTKTQKEAYESINKINMISYTLENGYQADYEKYMAELKSIFKNAEYEELMRGNIEDGGRFRLLLSGNTEALDELVLFGNSSKKGFVVVRVLGDDMNVNNLIDIGMSLKNIDPDNSNVKDVFNFFK
mgnify:CR=1 FL=1